MKGKYTGRQRHYMQMETDRVRRSWSAREVPYEGTVLRPERDYREERGGEAVGQGQEGKRL